MKKKIVALLAVVLMTGIAYGEPGDVWSLSGDMQNSINPSGTIDPGVVGGGGATWAYRTTSPAETSLSKAAIIGGNVSPDAPSAGVGWGHPFGGFDVEANKIMVVKFSVDADPNTPTIYTAGSVGGHTPVQITWTTDHDGFFDVSVLGYNAANPVIGIGTTQMILLVKGVLVVNAPLDASVNGIANALVEDATTKPELKNVALLVGETIKLDVSSNFSADWAGFDLTITEVIEPPICSAPPAADIDDNCWVDILDFAKINQDWLDCGILNLPLECLFVQ